MATIDKDRILQHRGREVCDRDGDKIGSIDEIYLDAETGEPEWALVHTGLFGTKRTFVPLREADEAEGALRVPFDKATVKDAPKIDAEGQLSQREEAELYRHYGLQYGESQAGQGAPEGNALSASTAPTTRTPPAPSGGTCPARRPMTP
jgi:sporulation protein YlmC with PRC-barrel domain